MEPQLEHKKYNSVNCKLNAKSVIMVKNLHLHSYGMFTLCPFMCEGSLKPWQQLKSLWDWWRLVTIFHSTKINLRCNFSLAHLNMYHKFN